MYLQIGSRRRPQNEAAAPNISYTPKYDARNQISSIEEVWDIRGRVTIDPASEDLMNVALRRLKADFDQINPSLRFLHDDGSTVSEFYLDSGDCIDGPRVISASFPSDAADIYATGIDYTVNYFAERRIGAGGSNPVIEFSETVEEVEGGQVNGFVGGSINFPELQVFMQHQPYTYVQSGIAVGLYGYVLAPGPLWPGFQLRKMHPRLTGPRKRGRINMEYVTEWTYVFGSLFPLVGYPHQL